MFFRDCGELRYYLFDSFEPDICQAIFTRRGGVSPRPWASLNMGSTVGDDPKRVVTNRHLALDSLGRAVPDVFDVWQVHGVDVAIGKATRPTGKPHQRADAILTNKPGLTLLMRFADCVPIFLHDPVKKVVGLAHAGWMGTVRGIIPATIEAMKSRFGSKPKNIMAGIGPSIGPDHYVVGEEVANQVKKAFGSDSSFLLSRKEDQTFFDLWKASRLSLEGAGILHIETSGICTACHIDEWYSHRAEHGHTGRFGAVIALR